MNNYGMGKETDLVARTVREVGWMAHVVPGEVWIGNEGCKASGCPGQW